MESLCEENLVAGLELLDKRKIYQALIDAIPGIKLHETSEEDQLIYENTEDLSTFLIFGNDFYFGVEAHGVSATILNTIVDIAEDFKCPVYDPQQDKRQPDL
jgi:hypothetical protein